MYVTQIYDPNAFLEKARQTGAEVRVLRSPTVVPVTEGSAVLMRPAVEVQYSIQFKNEDGEWSWVFRETHLADARGNVRLAGALLDCLAAKDLPHVILNRSGSI